MATGSAKVVCAPGLSVGLTKYYRSTEIDGTEPGLGRGLAISSYYADSDTDTRPPLSFGPDDVAFRADQVRGSGAAAMGFDFSQGITQRQFQNLLEGKHPDTGDQLVRHLKTPVWEKDDQGKHVLDDRGERVQARDPKTGKFLTALQQPLAGIDFYLAAPKSVSVALAVAGAADSPLAAAIYSAHDEAVEKTRQWVEAEVGLGRRAVPRDPDAPPRLVTKGPRRGEVCETQGSQTERVPVQLIMIGATQTVARPTEETRAYGAPGDVQLHSHTLALNMAFDPTTGTIKGIDEYALKDAPSAVQRDARYLGSLASGLESRGIELEYGSFEDSLHGRVPWRVKGITEEATHLFSSNSRRAWTLAKEYEEEFDKPATGRVLKERMKGTRSAKDALTKEQDTRPVFQRWMNYAQRRGVTLSTPDFDRSLQHQTRAPIKLQPLAKRRQTLIDRLDSGKGLTREHAVFDKDEAEASIAAAAEGLRLTDEEFDALRQELFANFEVVAGDPVTDPHYTLYTTKTQVSNERRLELLLDAKAGKSTAGVSAEAMNRAIATSSVPLDSEQRSTAAKVASGQSLTIIEGDAGTGKTTMLHAAVRAMRADKTIDNVWAVSPAARTGTDTGHKIEANYAGSVAKLCQAIEKGHLKPTKRTHVVLDEAAFCNTAEMKRFVEAIGPARLTLVGDPHQAQAIGAAGWYDDLTQRHGKELLRAVHRHNDARDTRDFKLVREGRGDVAVENLHARGRLHITDTEQDALRQMMADYTEFRQRYDAEDVRLVFDGSNQSVDVANRQVQNYRLRNGELGLTSMDVESTLHDRRWTLYEGDRVITRTPIGKGKGRIDNGREATIMRLNPIKGRVELLLDDGRRVKVQLSPRAEQQPIVPSYAVHNAKFQGGQAPVILYGPAANTDKNRAYSALTRCTDETHVYLSYESHGDQPKATVAKAWSTSPARPSAQRMLGQAMPERKRQPASSAARPTVAEVQQRLSTLRNQRHLHRHAGPDVAKAIVEAPSYNALDKRLTDLDRSGADVTRMLRTAADERELATAKDPAAVMLYRLDRTPVVQRSRAGEGLGLVPPPQLSRSTEQEARARARARARQPVDVHTKELTALVGPELATSIQSSPAYSTLVKRLDDLHDQGADAPAMLASAVQKRELDTAKDPAAVLAHRLARTERIEAPQPDLSHQHQGPSHSRSYGLGGRGISY